MFQLDLTRAAVRDLDSLPDRVARRIEGAIAALAAEPRPRGCLKLTNCDDTWRIRVGDYRVLYDIDDAAHTVTVLRVRHRRDVYR